MVSIETLLVDSLYVPVEKLLLCVIENGILRAAFSIFNWGSEWLDELFGWYWACCSLLNDYFRL